VKIKCKMIFSPQTRQMYKSWMVTQKKQHLQVSKTKVWDRVVMPCVPAQGQETTISYHNALRLFVLMMTKHPRIAKNPPVLLRAELGKWKLTWSGGIAMGWRICTYLSPLGGYLNVIFPGMNCVQGAHSRRLSFTNPGKIWNFAEKSLENKIFGIKKSIGKNQLSILFIYIFLATGLRNKKNRWVQSH